MLDHNRLSGPINAPCAENVAEEVLRGDCGKSMSATRTRIEMLPKRPRALRHVEKPSANLPEYLGGPPGTGKKLETLARAENEIRRPYPFVDTLLDSVGAELVKHAAPKTGMAFGGGRPEKESAVLACFGTFSGKLQRTVRLAAGIVAKPFARPALPEYFRFYRFGLVCHFGHSVEIRTDFESACVHHV